MWKYCNFNKLIRFADWIQLTESPAVWTKFQSPWESMCVSHLLEDLAVRLYLILLAQHLPRAEAVSLREVYYSVFKHFIQSIHTLMQQGHQLLLIDHGPVRPCRIPAYLTGQKIRMRSRGKIWTCTTSTGEQNVSGNTIARKCKPICGLIPHICNQQFH